MKQFLVGILIISATANIVLALHINHTKRESKLESVSSNEFSITNLDDGAGATMYIVAFQNGKYWWTIDQGLLSMNAGVNQEAILRLDQTSGRVKSTTIELYNSTNAHCYYTDFNADGIPDKKRINGDDNWQIFYQGEFVPSFTKDTNRYIVKEGSNIFVHFNGTRWESIK